MRNRYIVKRFSEPEFACDFLNSLEEESQDKTAYNGHCFIYEIIAFYREKEETILVYKITS